MRARSLSWSVSKRKYNHARFCLSDPVSTGEETQAFQVSEKSIHSTTPPPNNFSTYNE